MADRSLLLSLLCAIVLLAGCSTGYGPSNYDADAPTEYTTTESGLKYRILRKSDKPKPHETSHVKVDYVGTLPDGTVFDSTYERGQPATLNLYNVVKGFREGLQLVGEGGMIEINIPSELGYGELGQRNAVPPNTDIHFIVEVIRVFDRK
ncbi:FKBP-type peptidyl-prolyl cis-trans isomerase [Rhodopirellula sp. MGV]|uniref:FKBP-type peptidyl-prolyl cis-trans isomerase n=1 Tax=Rhodopirellula sp. MGV TaxID=2023130 RepID=UPI000B96FAC2|nr:FKBP-type peptidyl-prolyl cis-trans isomerase [Rhodopirellula sp. MGV]OYP36675.1 FKBP-type peptidylprolyl isomerase [Rhodopirellula sp. MGV]PNY36127.1 FKBP-type peptidylprolyl isomerase [Rhodopirellula baltica]PNY36128.1 FKBP-type peptidylprolyl isomerase [Rhodopirellula baltica]